MELYEFNAVLVFHGYALHHSARLIYEPYHTFTVDSLTSPACSCCGIAAFHKVEEKYSVYKLGIVLPFLVQSPSVQYY